MTEISTGALVHKTLVEYYHSYGRLVSELYIELGLLTLGCRLIERQVLLLFITWNSH